METQFYSLKKAVILLTVTMLTLFTSTNNLSIDAQQQENIAANSVVPSKLVDPDHLLIESNEMNENLTIDIFLPETYNENRSIGYPVLYYVDHYFGGAINQFLHDYKENFINYTEWFYQNTIPEIIVTIIRFENSTDFDLYNYTMYERSDEYYAFLTEELIPIVDSTYNTLPEERGLFGFFNAGYFVLNTAFRFPNVVFNRFFIFLGSISLVHSEDEEVKFEDPLMDRLIQDEAELYDRLNNTKELPITIYQMSELVSSEFYDPASEIREIIYNHSYYRLNYKLRTCIADACFGYFGQIVDSYIVGLEYLYNTDIIAEYSAPREINVSETIKFLFTGSYGNKTQVEFHWDFGDGQISTFRSPTHIYDTPGTYVVNLTIFDEFGNTASYTKRDRTPDKKPVPVYVLNIDGSVESAISGFHNTESYKKKSDINPNEFTIPNYVLLGFGGLILLVLVFRKLRSFIKNIRK